MFKVFATEIYKSLVERGFDLSTTFTNSAEITDATHCIVLDNYLGNSFLIVAVSDIEGIGKAAFDNFVEQYTSNLESIYTKLNVKNIFVVHILPFKNDLTSVEQIVQSGQLFDNQLVYNIFWGASLETGNVLVNKDQPNDIGDVGKVVSSCLKKVSEAARKGAHIEDDNSIGGLNEYKAKKKAEDIKERSIKAVLFLIFINISVFAAMYVLNAVDQIILLTAIDSVAIFANNEYYRLITAGFVHAGFMHVLSNCLSIYIFGSRTNKYYGTLKFLIIYFFSLLIGSVASLIFSNSISVGASGAVYGLIGAVAVKAFVSKRAVDGLSGYVIALFIASGFVLSMTLPMIDVFGHLGGFLGGILISFFII